MYQFRVKRSESELIDKLDNVSNRNGYITNLILEDIRPSVLTIKQIKERIKPVMERHGIKTVYLFGSYARGEANSNSDVDIYCDRGDVDTLFKAVAFNDELEKALGKKVDVVTIGSRMHDFFRQQLEEDMIKICWDNQIDTNLG
jgi:predicted nucleotidyltransferase